MKKCVSLLVFMLLCSVVIVGQSVNLVCPQESLTILSDGGDGEAGESQPVSDGGDGEADEAPSDVQAGSGITIGSDGSVEGTDKIRRAGSVYTFTGDISGAIKVERDGVTIDGAGHTLRGGSINLQKSGGYLASCYGNVVVKNVKFDNSYIFASSNGNNFSNNKFTGGGIHVVGSDGSGNTIKRNVFTNSPTAIFVDKPYTYNQGGDVITENDFINSNIDIRFADPVIDKNYYSDYRQQNPNAKVTGSNTWDTPYQGSSSMGNPFVDNNPLVKSISGYVSPYDNLGPSENKSEDKSEAHDDNFEISEDNIEVSENEKGFELFSSTLIMVVVVVIIIVVVSVSLLVYFKGATLKK